MIYLGIDIGGTKIKTVVMDDSGKILEQNEIPTEDGSGEAELWKKKIIAVISEKSQKYAGGNPDMLKCGISAPGLVDSENKMTLHMPERLLGIENFNWSVELGNAIKVINDGHSACLAEYESYYRFEGIKHMLMLTLGTGIGGGIIINGKLYQGNHQRAGHVGHMTIDINGTQTMTNMPGSLEHAMGNFSVSERTQGKYKSVRELVDAFENGNTDAKVWWLKSIKRLAAGLASLTNILSPELIVLGGGITAGAGDSLLEPLKKSMADYEWRPGGHQIKIVKAKLGGYAGAIGAAYFAKNTL
ncbi:ROK family protein [Maribacter halichondriae]|uniref:ROK family protein n=1 Tax=Maribacter halichondriae TaxID=2980554 RepID=UPI002359F6EC|nr:ROK family protein [Maribacter sp. Hal144]